MGSLSMYLSAADWESLFAPYDDATYAAALAALQPDDIVLDIGAGDLRFTRRVAERVTRVIAIERQAELLRGEVPQNLDAICADARTIEFPKNITAALLLMRHCRHFSLYREKLQRAGCKKLITNARWGMDVEVIELDGPRLTFDVFEGGWYGCDCGRAGYQVSEIVLNDTFTALSTCPGCV